MSTDHRRQPADTSALDRSDMTEHRELAELVGSLIQMMRSGNLSRMDLEHGDLRLSLHANNGVPTTVASPSNQDGSAPEHGGDREPESGEGRHTITAPMIGTFYTSPAPNEPPFVQPGDRIGEGETIGIIEAMKIMNEIAADRAGTIVEIVAKNAQTVEYGSPLVAIIPDPD